MSINYRSVNQPLARIATLVNHANGKTSAVTQMTVLLEYIDLIFSRFGEIMKLIRAWKLSVSTHVRCEPRETPYGTLNHGGSNIWHQPYPQHSKLIGYLTTSYTIT